MERPRIRIVEFSDGNVQVQSKDSKVLLTIEFKGAPSELLDDDARIKVGRAAAQAMVDGMIAEGVWTERLDSRI